MKKLIYIPVIALLTISIATAFVSCKPSAKEEAAQEKVEEAKDDLAEAKKEAD
jgi:hypothetical protein